MEFTEEQIHNATAKQILYDIDFYTSGIIEPCREEYNGWCNHETWLFNLNVTNSYFLVKTLEADIKYMSLKDFVQFVLNYRSLFADKIDFRKVHFKEVYEAFKDD